MNKYSLNVGDQAIVKGILKSSNLISGTEAVCLHWIRIRLIGIKLLNLLKATVGNQDWTAA